MRPTWPADLPVASPSLEELAAEQGVGPIRDLASLMGTPQPGDETAEEFAAMLRDWRREGRSDREL